MISSNRFMLENELKTYFSKDSFRVSMLTIGI